MIKDKMNKSLSTASAPGYILLMLAVILNILIQGGDFFSSWNLSTLFNVATPLILVSLAQLIIILAGGVDLSLGASMAVVNALAIQIPLVTGWGYFPSWLLAFSAAIVIGGMNGVLVGYLRLPPFLATFASSSIVQGLALLILPSPGGTVPREIYSWYNGSSLGIPNPVFIAALALVIWVYIDRNPLGNQIRAVGANPRNAFITGINPDRTLLKAFLLGGVFAGLAGLSLTALMASGDPWVGAPYSLRSMAAVILGGCLFNSGWGGAGGTVSGALFFVIVSNIVFFGFNYLQMNIPGFQVSTFYQDLTSNLIIVFGLVSSVFFKSIRHRAVLRSIRKGADDE